MTLGASPMGRRLLLALAAVVLMPASSVRLERSHPHKPHKTAEVEEHHHKHEKVKEAHGTGSRSKEANEVHCAAPEPGDKVVYFLRHQLQDFKLGSDPPLLDAILQMTYFTRANPKLAAAVSSNERHRAQLVLVSPFTRTMETAVLGFGGLFGPDQFKLNTDLMEYQVSDRATPKNGEAMLTKLNATDMLQKYRQLPEGWVDSAGDHVERWKRFEEYLRQSTEERFIVVSHHWMMKRAGHALHYGEVGISAFTPSGEWKMLDDPSCWPDFREEYAEIMASRRTEAKAQH